MLEPPQPSTATPLSRSLNPSPSAFRAESGDGFPVAPPHGLRIGVDAACWTSERGYGRFTRELLKAMVALAPRDRFFFFLDRRTEDGFDLQGPNVHRVAVGLSAPPAHAASAKGSRSLADMLRLSRAVARTGLDVFFCPSVYTYFPLPPRLACLMTIHDAIPERHPSLTLPSVRARLFWRLKVALALRQADLVLTVSDYSAREIADALRVRSSRIRVAGEAAAASFRPSDSPAQIAAAAASVGLPPEARWFIYVGGFNPHKDVDALVRAHAILVRESSSPPPYLLLVGPLESDVFHKEPARIREAISESGTERLVFWTGYLPDEEVRHLLSGALGLVLPSRREGFGLPAVEAAACGTPVIATTESPLPQLLKGGGRFVRPGDEHGLVEALRYFCNDAAGRRAMGAEARRRATQLRWVDGARVALDAIHELAP